MVTPWQLSIGCEVWEWTRLGLSVVLDGTRGRFSMGLTALYTYTGSSSATMWGRS